MDTFVYQESTIYIYIYTLEGLIEGKRGGTGTGILATILFLRVIQRLGRSGNRSRKNSRHNILEGSRESKSASIVPSRRGHTGTARATCLCVTRLRFAARVPLPLPLPLSLSLYLALALAPRIGPYSSPIPPGLGWAPIAFPL